MDSDLCAILDALRDLQGAAHGLMTPAGQMRDFHNHPVLSQRVVRDFEELHRISLPAGYRDFLLQVGNGGAGGVFKLGECDDGDGYRRWHENDGFVGTLTEPFPHTQAWNDLTGLPCNDRDDPEGEAEFWRQWQVFEKRYLDPANVNGAIPICHEGCAHRDWLIVTGPERGNIWHDSRTTQDGLYPAQQSGSARLTFLQWYRSWLGLDNAVRRVRQARAG